MIYLHCRGRITTAYPSKRVKRNSIIGKELLLCEDQLNGKFKRRLCSAKAPCNKNKANVKSSVFPLNFEEKNYIVNGTEYENIQLIMASSPKSFIQKSKINLSFQSGKDEEENIIKKEDFLYKVQLPEQIRENIK